jgi:hypothetical protein
MDNCLSHVGEVILTFLREATVGVITVTPQTTQIFRTLVESTVLSCPISLSATESRALSHF